MDFFFFKNWLQTYIDGRETDIGTWSFENQCLKWHRELQWCENTVFFSEIQDFRRCSFFGPKNHFAFLNRSCGMLRHSGNFRGSVGLAFLRVLWGPGPQKKCFLPGPARAPDLRRMTERASAGARSVMNYHQLRTTPLTLFGVKCEGHD